MAYRLLDNGTIEADTLEELLQLKEMQMQKRSVSSTNDANQSKPRRRGRTRKSTTTSGRGWTPRSAKKFLGSVAPKTREVIAAAIEVGDGATSMELADRLETAPTGIGRRVLKVGNDAARFDETLPPPVQLVGDIGSKVVAVDPTFRKANGTEVES
jgi:hypothetical protein